MKATQRETLTGMFIDAPSPHRPVVRTSILAHQAHGGFTGRKQLVFEALRSYDARFLPTSAELANALPAQPDADRTAMLLLARRGLSDLLSAGYVEHGPMRKCIVSGEMCVTWLLRTR